jgi:hypothetical protein
VADRLAREIPGAWRANQFANMTNPEVHYRTTGPEIWDQTDGKITVFVSGVGTGGTVSGVARYLKEMNSEIKIIGADPEGSVLSGGNGKPWKVEGIGEDFVPQTFNGQLVDEWVRIGDAEAFQTARMLARREGLLLEARPDQGLRRPLSSALHQAVRELGHPDEGSVTHVLGVLRSFAQRDAGAGARLRDQWHPGIGARPPGLVLLHR